jgi:hypothetical protein
MSCSVTTSGTPGRNGAVLLVHYIEAERADDVRQPALLSQRVGPTGHGNNSAVGRFVQYLIVLIGLHKNVVLVEITELLQMPDKLQGHAIHAVFVGPEQALGFDANA